MSAVSLRNTIISIFVFFWIILFNYESIRYFYLQPHFNKPLWKMPYLFPPAGWIMFFNVNESYGTTEVYGVKANTPFLIDPHDIFRTRTIGFDNIHRNIMSTIANESLQKPFCSYLERKFPQYDRFLINVVYYPSVIKSPPEILQEVKYQCANP